MAREWSARCQPAGLASKEAIGKNTVMRSIEGRTEADPMVASGSVSTERI